MLLVSVFRSFSRNPAIAESKRILDMLLNRTGIVKVRVGEYGLVSPDDEAAIERVNGANGIGFPLNVRRSNRY